MIKRVNDLQSVNYKNTNFELKNLNNIDFDHGIKSLKNGQFY
jgi:hypothetical protein